MIWALLISLVLGTTGLTVLARSRSAQLSRLARNSGCTFHKHKSSVTTQLTAGRLEFFTQFFHQYSNVFTYSDTFSFIRIADDTIYTDDKPKTKPIPITIFTAELKKRQFPLLKVAPLSSPFALSQYALMKTNIPTIDGHYRIHAPTAASGILFTPLITGLLKTRSQIYLELNENALVYHEHALIPVEDMELFRFRAMQILGELEGLMEKLEQTDAETATFFASDEKTTPEKRAEAMLRFGTAQEPTPTKNPIGSFRSVGFFVLLLILLGISFLSWFALNNWVGR